MKKISLLIVFGCICFGLCPAQSGTTSPARSAVPLRDGTLYSGVEGAVRKDPNQSTWYFVATGDITDGTATIPAGEAIEMLPCSTLDKIIAAAGQNPSINGKLWARVTRYSNRNILMDQLPGRKFINRKARNKDLLDSKFLSENLVNKNFLFAAYFIPMTDDAPVEPEPGADKPQAITVKQPGEDIIPEDVLEQLNRKRVVDLKKIKDMLESEGDVVLADRIGFVTIDNDQKVFTVDGLGRNVEDLKFTLLPCEALEFTEKSLVETPVVRQRFRVSGIVTTSGGKSYMLIQRAVRTYSHGNFAR
ncbi:MAG: hypothetical protein IH624_09230 [Phycisphaerae bacterium]|nr:hypothetical protein [Phycisphaerae bacterium]